jgi:hypothetical protein
MAATAAAQPSCDLLPPPGGTVVNVTPDQADELRAIVAAAATGTTIQLQDGFYDMSGGDAGHRLSFNTAGVTLRSASGNRGAVTLDGAYGTNELISIHASNVTIADITLMRAYDHPIHMSGNPGNPISGILVRNVRVVDPGQQAIKINPLGDGYVDDSVIECSLIELTAAGRAEIRDGCYTGGVDAHQAQGWIVRRNRFEGFWCDTGLSEHAVHFWFGSRDTLVEENVIVDCARGIGFGLGSGGITRSYPDNPYPGIGYMGHIDGIIRNNFIAAGATDLFGSPDGFTTGIGLEQAHGAIVVHNTVASTQEPLSSSIEWRFQNSDPEIANNLASSDLLQRDGASATLTTNIEHCSLNWFSDVAAGDLHLVGGAGAIDSGTTLPAGLADTDIDGEVRDARPDVGGDEAPDSIFSDGFELIIPSVW